MATYEAETVYQLHLNHNDDLTEVLLDSPVSCEVDLRKTAWVDIFRSRYAIDRVYF